jgi:hypothetical protein
MEGWLPQPIPPVFPVSLELPSSSVLPYLSDEGWWLVVVVLAMRWQCDVM